MTSYARKECQMHGAKSSIIIHVGKRQRTVATEDYVIESHRKE